MSKYFTWKNIEHSLGGLKFAVIIISIFTIFMVIGTFIESYSGAEFANRLIYKSPVFMIIQFFMAISVILAAYTRLPAKKRLYGFYTIHTSLVIILAGSFITWYSGIDGSITLPPKTPSNRLALPGDILEIQYPSQGKIVKRHLPNAALSTNINDSYQNIELLTYLPYSNETLKWIKPQLVNNRYSSGKYKIFSPMASEEVVLSLHPEVTDFPSSTSLGPLNIHYLPSALGDCFRKSDSKFIIWNKDKYICSTPKDHGVNVQKLSSGKIFFAIKEDNKVLSFFPEYSPYPVSNIKSMQINRDSPLLVFNKNFFTKKPHLLIFGESVAFYSDNRWFFEKLNKNKSINLPWMGFELSMTDFYKNMIPKYIPEYTIPIEKDGKRIRGANRAILIKIKDKKHWVTDSKPLSIMINDNLINILLKQNEKYLPFQLTLDKFLMKTDPGTSRPASYESFITLFDKKDQKHHIYMNNPLDYRSFTFYQASYSQDESGAYTSTLSVNFDPGRSIKYFGSFMLVLGTIWHFYLTNKRKRALT